MEGEERWQSLVNTKNHLASYKKIRGTQPEFDESLKTPIFQRKKRKFIRDLDETEKLEIKKRKIMGSKKWLFKTALKVVAPLTHTNSKEAIQKETTLSKLKSFTRASQANLRKQITLFEEKRAIIKALLQKNERVYSQNICLKKGLLTYDAKRNTILCMIDKCKTIDFQVRESELESQRLSQVVQQKLREVDNLKKDINSFREWTFRALRDSEKVEKEIEELLPILETKRNEIKELSIIKLPNQKQILSCMFSIGILNQQIYILELQKNLRKSLLAESLKLTKGEKDPKTKQNQIRNINLKIRENQINRLVTIDCQSTQILVFKILTVIYMHCRSLMLNNIATLLKKTSYFAQEFKQIYLYQYYEKYLSNLIERYKGNEKVTNLSIDSTPISSKSNIKTAIVSNKSNIPYLQWILQSFEQQGDPTLNFDHTTFEFSFYSFEELAQKQNKGGSWAQGIDASILIRVVLQNFDSELFWK